MRHPQNAVGKYWIDQDVCVACCVCLGEAPGNIAFDDASGRSYIYKQPENETEVAAVRESLTMCPVEAPREDA